MSENKLERIVKEFLADKSFDVSSIRGLCFDLLDEVGADDMGGCPLCQN